MYSLYYAPGLASMAPHFILKELAVPHQLILVDRSTGGQKTPEYLAINPNARIPTFSDDGFILYEAAAICLHLSDRHPESKFMPALGSLERSTAYKHLIFLTNTLQADLWHWYRPEFYVGPEAFQNYRDTLEPQISRHLEVLDKALEGRNYFVGDTPTLPDFYLLMLARWTRALRKTSREFPNIQALVDRLLLRPACREVFTIEGLSLP